MHTLQNADRLWSSLLREYDFLKVKVDVQEKIQETRKQLKRKEVIVSVFGRHNCGKSTLLNALLGNRYIFLQRELLIMIIYKICDYT